MSNLGLSKALLIGMFEVIVATALGQDGGGAAARPASRSPAGHWDCRWA